MNVIKIVANELPECCEKCDFYKPPYYRLSDCSYCRSKTEYILDKDLLSRPEWCPLVVEEVCEYVGEYGGWNEHGDTIFFSRKTGCSDEHYQKIVVPDYKFCPNCGKRIKYVEVE